MHEVYPCSDVTNRKSNEGLREIDVHIKKKKNIKKLMYVFTDKLGTLLPH